MDIRLKHYLLSAKNSQINKTRLNYKHKKSIINNILVQADSIWLNSHYQLTENSRIDILSAKPLFKIITEKKNTQVKNNKNEILCSTSQCPFTLISNYATLAENKQAPQPFCAGFIGHLSYDLARRLEKLPTKAKPTTNLPQLQVGFYHWSVIINHASQTITLYYLPINPLLKQTTLINQLTHVPIYNPVTPRPLATKNLQSNLPKEKYTQAFNTIKQALTDGNCYQVNLAQKFNLPYAENPIDLYYHLCQYTQAPFSSLINYKHQQILCFSPERFLKISSKGEIETKPIKGTIARSSNPIIDNHNAQILLHSSKDRAENLMIVDLLRNDLGKHCLPGSIKVPELFKLESYSVHHLVSKITGKTNIPPLLFLKSCFPGGSITGAPKISAMTYIEQLEPHRRDIYCGSIFYLNLAGNLDSNITIRTLLLENKQLHFWAGGGLVADSTLEGEYNESFNKIEFILNALLIPNK